MHPNTDLSIVGKRFGKIVVDGFSHVENGRARFNIQCDCGNTNISVGKDIKQGKINSCGCSHDGNPSHGQTNTRLYRIWKGMRQRCYNSNTPYFHIYGGKGVTVCSEWDLSYESFRDWALSNGYKSNLTIDRENNDGNYEPSNCRWITNKEQCNNNSRNHHLTHNGITKTMSEWSDIVGISRSNIDHRINLGWPVDRILTTPVRKLTRKTA